MRMGVRFPLRRIYPLLSSTPETISKAFSFKCGTEAIHGEGFIPPPQPPLEQR